MLGKKLIEYYKAGDKIRAFATCRTIQLNYRLNPDAPELAKDFYNVGCVYQKYKDFSRAFDAFLKASKNVKESKLAYRIFTNLAICCYEKVSMGDATNDVIKYMTRAVEYAKDGFGENSGEYANAVYNLAVMHYEAGDYETALEYFYKQLGNDDNDIYIADTLSYIGYCLEKLGGMERAVMFHMQALARLEKIESEYKHTAEIYYLAVLTYKNKDYDSAFSYISRVIDILDNLGETKSVFYIDVLSMLAKVYLGEKNYAKAVSTVNKALFVGDEIRLPLSHKAQSERLLADIYFAGENYSKAFDICEEIYALDEKYNLKEIFDDCIKAIRMAIYADKTDACEKYEQKLLECPKNPSERYLRCMYSLIKLYIKSGENDKITDIYENRIIMVNPNISYEDVMAVCISDDIEDTYVGQDEDEFFDDDDDYDFEEYDEDDDDDYDGYFEDVNKYIDDDYEQNYTVDDTDSIIEKFRAVGAKIPDISEMTQGDAPDIDTFREKVYNFLDALRIFKEHHPHSSMTDVVDIIEHNFSKNLEYMEKNERTRLMVSNMIDKFLRNFGDVN